MAQIQGTVYSPLPKSYNTLEGKPLIGKVEYRDAISNTLLPTYSWSKTSGYVTGPNPVYTNVYGMVDQVFTANTLVLICLYSYIGDYSDMTIDTRTSSWKHEYDYYACFDTVESEGKNYYEGISALVSAPISSGYATVVGYYTSTDCMARTYVWDATATDDEDGGYVIKSANSETGRWILVWNQEALPNELYGVTSSNYTNLNNLLSYKSAIGTKQIPTCRQIEFTNLVLPTTYGNTLTTTKSIKVSSDCYFGTGQFKVGDVEVTGVGGSNIGNFYITDTDNDTTVMSSWYNNIQYFFWSNANHLIYDAIPSTNKVTSNTTLENCTLEFTRDWNTVLKANLTFKNVHLLMSPDFYIDTAETKYMYLVNMTIDTRNFRNLAVSHCTNCVINVRNTFTYDQDSESSNEIHTHTGAEVKSDYTVDTDWFCSIADYTLNCEAKFHNTAYVKKLKYPQNINNCDMTDCTTIDFEGYNSTAAFSVNKDLTAITLVNVPDILLTIVNTTDSSGSYLDKTVIIKDSVFKLNQLNYVQLYNSLSLKVVNSTMKFTRPYLNTLGKVVVIEDSVISDESDYATDDDGNKIAMNPVQIGSLDIIHSEVDSKRTFTVNTNLRMYESVFSNAGDSDMNPGDINCVGDLDVSHNQLNSIYIRFIGEENTLHTVNYIGNRLNRANIGWETSSSGYSDNCRGVATGNTITSGSIFLKVGATPEHYRITDNAGTTKTTNWGTKVFYGTAVAAGLLTGTNSCEASRRLVGVNNQWLYDYEIDSDTYTGRAEEIYNWIQSHCYFASAKTSSQSYDDAIKQIIEDGKITIRQIQRPGTGDTNIKVTGFPLYNDIFVYPNYSV